MAEPANSQQKNIFQEDLNAIFVKPLVEKYIYGLINAPSSVLLPSVYYINSQSRTQKPRKGK